MSDLTRPQERIHGFISEQVQDKGVPPTIREIAARFRVSIGTVQDHLAALERKGILKRLQDRARGLVLAVRPDARARVPLLGSVPAGMPAEAVSRSDDYFAVDDSIAKRANFALRVKGDSMYPALWDGDLILVQFTPEAESGEIVVASVGGDDATVKKLRKTETEVYLEAINPAYGPIRGDISIVGRVTSLIRPFFRP